MMKFEICFLQVFCVVAQNEQELHGVAQICYRTSFKNPKKASYLLVGSLITISAGHLVITKLTVSANGFLQKIGVIFMWNQ